MKWLILFSFFFGRFEFYRNIDFQQQDTNSILSILDQPFTYLGEGAQMVVFASQDGTTVLKLFKGRHKQPFKFSRFISHLRRSKADWEASEARWQGKFADTCRRYEMAFEYLKEETGLIFLHFYQTSNPLEVTLIDKNTYRVNLAELPFILQKRAILAPEYVKQNPSAVEALKDFFVRRIEKGFSDPRQSLSINYGFIDGKPIQIDVGKIERFDGDVEAELKKIHAHVDSWALSL